MSVSSAKKAKGRIIDAALELFYFQGFRGTTVRQIATKAEVNQALVSYYFGSKKGLLEALMIQFYEEYFKTLDEQKQKSLQVTPDHVQPDTAGQEGHHLDDKNDDRNLVIEQLFSVVQAAFDYLFSRYQMTRFIYRELSMDSMLIREIMTTYLTKEKYYYLSILELNEQRALVEHGPSQTSASLYDGFDEQDEEMLVLQLLNALYMPFLQPQAIREVYYMEPHSEDFKQRYLQQLKITLMSAFTSQPIRPADTE